MRRISALLSFVAFLLLSVTSVLGQGLVAPAQSDRVPAMFNAADKVQLAGHVPAWIRTETDLGEVPAETPMRRLVVTLKRDPAVEAAFQKFRAEQADPASPHYRQWLTPEQLGELYGPTRHDREAVARWLGDAGLHVDSVDPSGMFLVFSGTAKSVGSALSVNLHRYQALGATKSYIGSATEPSVPAALEPVVAVFVGLMETPLHTYSHHTTQQGPAAPGQSAPLGAPANAAPASQGAGAQPDAAYNYQFYIGAGDFASMYGALPLQTLTNSGTGQHVAVLIDSLVNHSDVPSAGGVVNVVPPFTTSPGYTSDQFEGELDVDMVASTAGSASIDVVVGNDLLPNTIMSLVQYAANTLKDPVISMSFGECEVNAGSATTKAFDTMFQGLSTQGVAVYVSSGDAGAAGCDPHGANTQLPTNQVLSTNYLCSSGAVTCVGGTDFTNAAINVFTYSNYFTPSFNFPTDSGRVDSYLPEGGWNEPGYTGGYYNSNASGGGASVYISKPSWQTGVGVPADGARDTPDIAFHASASNGYLINAPSLGYTCTPAPAGTSGCAIVSGTSAPTPAMAGIHAMLNALAGKSIGNVNAQLYGLPSLSYGSLIVHDVNPTTGNYTSCPLTTPAPCNNSTPSTNNPTGGLNGYAVATGYDQVTGLGSIDAYGVAQAVVGTGTLPVTLAAYKTGTTSLGSGVTGTTISAQFLGSYSPMPTGYFRFIFDGMPIGPAFPIGTAPNTVAGRVASNYFLPSQTSKTFSVLYYGDANYAMTTSPTYQDALSPTPTQTLSKSPTTVTTLSPFTLYDAVQEAGGPVPTGTVTFYYTNVATSKTLPLATVTGTSGSYSVSGLNFLPGSYTAYAVYNGDQTYLPSTSATYAFTVGNSPIGISGTTTSSTLYQQEVFPVTVTLTTPSASAPAPTGATTVTCTTGAAVSGSTYTLTSPTTYSITLMITANGVGTGTCALAFAADATYTAETATIAGPTVVKGQTVTSMTIASASSPAYVNNLNVITITMVTQPGLPAPTGIVQLESFDPNDVQQPFATTSTFTQVNATTYTATFATSPGSAGTWIYEAFLTDPVLGKADSGYLYLSIVKCCATVTSENLTAAQTNVATGVVDQLTLTMSVAAGAPAPTGGVSFAYNIPGNSISVGGTNTFTQVSANTYTASIPATFNTPGVDSVAAYFSGSGAYAAFTSNFVNITVTGPSVSSALTATSNSVNVGSSDSLLLTLTTSSTTAPAPTGTVTFYDNGVSVGTSSTFTQAAAGMYTVPFSQIFKGGGNHVMTATYSGNSLYATQTATTTVFVNLFVPTISGNATTTFAYGAGGSLPITLVPTGTTIAPTGVIFYMIGSGSLLQTPVTNGTASIPVSTSLAAGTYNVLVEYGGDANFNPASNLTIKLVITQVKPTITWPAPSAIGYGTALSSLQLNAQASVPGSFAYTPASGTVLQAGTQTLTANFTPTDQTSASTASANVSLVVNAAPLTVKANDATRKYGASNPAFTAVITGTVNNDVLTGSATTTATQTSAPGTYALVPTVTGTNAASYSIAPTNGTLTITQAGTTDAVSLSAATIGLGASETFTATVLSSTTGTPTGAVQFMNGSTLLGSGTLNAGIATFTTTSLAVGSYSVTAVYAGDTNFTGSTSSAALVTVTAPTATLALSAASTSVALGVADALTLKLTPSGTIVPTGTVTFLDGSSVLGTSGLTASGTAYTASFNAAFTTGGSHSVTAMYSGGSGYAAQTSGAVTISVSKNSAAITAPPLTSLVYGAGGSITVSVGGTGTTAVPTGVLTYSIGSGSAQGATLVNGIASIPVPTSLALGTYPVVLGYAGDSSFNAAPNVTVSLTISKALPTITWNTPAPIVYGTALSGTQQNATASVAGTFAYSPAAGSVLAAGTQTLSVTFTPNDLVDYGPATASASLSVTPAPLAVKAANATRQYGAANPVFTATVTGAVNGDTFNASASSAATTTSAAGTYPIVPAVSGAASANYTITPTNGTLTVTQAGSASSLSVSAPSVSQGQSVTFTATITSSTSGTPTGMVQFMNGATALGSATLANGTGSYSTSSLAVGTYAVTAVYAGDSNFAASTSSAGSVTITAPTLTLGLAVAAMNVAVGTADALTATLTPSGTVVPTGSVTFYDNGSALGTVSGLTQSGSVYTATYSATFVAGGSHSITAAYSGGSGYVAQTSSAVTVTAVKAASAITAPATTSVAYASASSIAISVGGTGTSLVPTGSVSYTLGGAQSVALVKGAASIPIPATLAAGTYSVVLSYTGDTSFNAAANVTLTLTVTKAVPAITWATPAAVVYGTVLSGAQLNATSPIAGSFSYTPTTGSIPAAGSQTLTAVFTPADATDYSSATATVSLTVSPAPLTVKAASATRSYGVANPAFTATVTGAVNGDSFTASASTAATITSNAGTYNIVPVASGPALANYAVSAVNGTLTITQVSSATTLTTSAASVNAGQTLTFTASVASATGGAATGSVQFMNGSTVLGTGTLNGGTASFSTNTLAAGSYSVTAVYAGDANVTGSTSGAVSETVIMPDFTLTVSPTALTIKQGGSGSATFTLTPTGGFNQAVAFACSGVPAEATCVFSPASLTPAGAPLTSTLTITTAAPHAALEPLALPRGRSVGGGIAMAALLCCGALWRRRRVLRGAVLLLAFAAVMSALSGCGTKGSFSSPDAGTPAGTYSISISASSSAGSAAHTANLSVNVTQ